MNALLITLLLAAGAEEGLSASYACELRAEIALADHVVVRLSPENGGSIRSTDDLAELRGIARHFPKSARAVLSDGKIASVDYATISVYDKRGAERAAYEITVLPSRCVFRANDMQYEIKLPDRSLYDALLKAAANCQ